MLSHFPSLARFARLPLYFGVLFFCLLGVRIAHAGDPEAAETETLQVLDKAPTNTDARDVLAALVL